MLPTAPLAPRFATASAWTGTELIIWGGAANFGGRIRSDGAAYDPTADLWRVLADSPLGARESGQAVWTGQEALVWGGDRGGDGGPQVGDGASYRPTSDTWREIRPPPSEPDQDIWYEVVWTGTEMIIWGADRFDIRSYGWAYEPSGGEWRRLPDAPLSTRFNHTMIWTGKEVLVWGGTSAGDIQEPLGDGAAYDPATDSWRTLAAAPLDPRSSHTAVWVDDVMIVWGGRSEGDVRFRDGARYDPATDEWHLITEPSFDARWDATATAIGSEMLVWGGVARRSGCDPDVEDCAVLAGDGAIYQPGLDAWRPL